MEQLNTASDTKQLSWRAALRRVAVLGPLFFICHMAIGAYTASRPDVVTFQFGWETHIPFVGWSILPYWSILFFYFSCLFFCRTQKELDIHTLRLTAISVLCVVFYFIFPLKNPLVIPEQQGIVGDLYALLEYLKLAYNQAPSFHIALLMTFFSVARMRTPILLRWLLYTWMVVVTCSVLLSWQHQVMDVVTGVVLGIFVCYVFPHPKWRWRTWKNAKNPAAHKLAHFFGAITLATATTAVVGMTTMSNWFVWMLWPAFANGMVALAYMRLGVSVFQKNSQGKVAPAVFIVLFPYYVCSWILFRVNSSKVRAYNWVSSELVLGQYPEKSLLQGFFGNGKNKFPVVGVVDMTAGWRKSRLVDDLEYASCPRMDLVPPDEDELEQAVQTVHYLMRRGPVLVHCMLGFSRGATVGAAWLYASGAAETVEDAITRVRTARPSVVLREGHVSALRAWKKKYPREDRIWKEEL